MSGNLRYWLTLTRRNYSAADLRGYIADAKDAGVAFTDKGVPGSVWANRIEGPPMLKTIGAIHEVTDAPGTYRVVHYSDARTSDLGILAALADVLQRDGRPGFARLRPGVQKSLQTAKNGHLYVMCCRPLTDYHHRELAAVAGIQDTVPAEWSVLLDSTN